MRLIIDKSVPLKRLRTGKPCGHFKKQTRTQRHWSKKAVAVRQAVVVRIPEDLPLAVAVVDVGRTLHPLCPSMRQVTKAP